MTLKSPIVALALGLTGLMFVACGTVPTPNTPTTVSVPPNQVDITPTSDAELNATLEAADADPNTKTLVIENSLEHRGKTRGVRSSTSTSGPNGELSTTTIYMIDDTYVDFPWVAQSTTPDSTALPCSQIGAPGTWRGNPAPIGSIVAISEIELRIDESPTELDTISLVIENNGTANIELHRHSFQYIDKLQTQSRRGPRRYNPRFAEAIEISAEKTKSFTIDRNNLADDPIKAQDVVLMFSDRLNGDNAYLALTQPSDDTFICSSFETHADAQEVATTWSNRPAPLGKAAKIDESTTTRITYAERGTAKNLLGAYNDLDLQDFYPRNADGGIADGYEFLAFQIEVASTFPLMNGPDPLDPIDAIGVSGWIADEYSTEFENILATPGTANLVMFEYPSSEVDLNVNGYVRLTFVAVIPAAAHNLHVGYASEPFQNPVFLSLDEDPPPRPTPVPVARDADDDRMGFMEQTASWGEGRLDSLLESADSKEKLAFRRVTLHCAQHMVFPSGQSQRNVASTAQSLANGIFAETLPEYFNNAADPDAFCNDLYPPSSKLLMIDELLFDDETGIKATCAYSDQAGFSYFSSLTMWKAEVSFALWGDDAPVTIDSFGDIYELCDWLESYELTTDRILAVPVK